MTVDRDDILRAGVAFCIRRGMEKKHAYGLIGKLRKAKGDDAALALVQNAIEANISDPAAWFGAAVSKKSIIDSVMGDG